MIVLNSSWRGQRVTGQQRYAQEISRRLLRRPSVEARPSAVPSNRWAAWMASQTLTIPRKNETLLTLTSRGPLWHPRHVIVVHDHFVLTHPEWFSRQYAATHAPMLRSQIRSAKGLVFVSPATRDRHHELFGETKPHVVAPNGVSPPLIGNKNYHADSDYLLVVGSRDPRKNIGTLIQAFSMMGRGRAGEVRLVVTGGSDPSIFGGRESGVIDATGVEFTGYVTETELWSLYSRARAVVVPSLDEGFGLPLVEAAATGTPLAVSDIPVFRWIAGGSAIYFNPRDVSSMASALERVLGNPLSPPDISGFDWEVSATAIYEFVRSL